MTLKIMSLREFNSTVRQEEKENFYYDSFRTRKKAQPITELTSFKANLFLLVGLGTCQMEVT